MSFVHISRSHTEWEPLAEAQAANDAKADILYALPIKEFRKTPYCAPQLPTNSPIPGQDVIISEKVVVVRDGTSIPIRLYQPVQCESAALIFFNIHGGGSNSV